MNDNYIMRSDAVFAVQKRIEQIGMGNNPLVCSIRQAVRDAPAADVVEVRRGHWVYKMRERIRYEEVTGTDALGGTQTVTVKTHVRGPVPYCSLCDALAADSFLDYCPRCGAKMDEKDGGGGDD